MTYNCICLGAFGITRVQMGERDKEESGSDNLAKEQNEAAN
jgi:hypothetical protein